MSGYLKNNLKVFAPMGVLAVLLLTVPKTAVSWTSAHLFNVTVTADIASTGPSTVTTDARFVVEGGYFHGFDFVDLPGARLDDAAATAFLDDQREFNVIFKRARDGKIRVLLDNDEYVRSGGITFRIVHHVNFVESGALRLHENRARLDWTPLVWEVGLDNMQVQIRLPEGAVTPDPRVDETAAKDYVSTVSDTLVSFIKFRPVKWYPMRVVMDFDATVVGGLTPANSDPAPSVPQATVSLPPSGKMPLLRSLAFLGAVCLAGLSAAMFKARSVRNIYRTVGLTPQYLLLSRTSFGTRIVLALTAGASSAALQAFGYTAAGIIPLTFAAAVFLQKKIEGVQKPRGGGVWRKMNDQDLSWYTELFGAYAKSRSSFFDITTVKGALLFTVFSGGVVAIALLTQQKGTDVSLAASIDAMMLALPTWFSHIRAELPVDNTMEGFGLLKKWRKSLEKLVGKNAGAAKPEFYVREDDQGPVEVRLRTMLPVDGLHTIEAAAEVFMAGSLYRIRTVFVLRMTPGTPITRKLAACPHAAEHHLTPDLTEEIIVLRNRRGKTASGLSPLRAALYLIRA